MTYPRVARRGVLVRAALAFAAAGILTSGGFPPLQTTAHAAVTEVTGQRCDEMFGLKGDPADPSQLPWAKGQQARPKSEEDTYQYRVLEVNRGALIGRLIT